MQVLVAKWGDSLGLRLPEALAEELGLAEGQTVDVRAEGRKLVVEPARPKLTWEKMMENVTPEAMREAWDWGEDVGREIVDD